MIGSSLPMGRRLCLLALLAAPLGCALPLNTAPREWSRLAGLVIDRPGFAATPRDAAVQDALAAYFYALGVLWDGAALPFREAEFLALVPRTQGAEAAAITALAEHLRTASLDTPPRWLPNENSSARPAYEDRRLPQLIIASDAAVQVLLTALAHSPATPPPAAALPEDPIQQALADEARRQRERQRTARATYARLLGEIGATHAALRALGWRISQRATELELRGAMDRLQRGMVQLPPEAPRPEPRLLPTMPLP